MIEYRPLSTTGVFGPVASGKTFLLKQWVASQNRVVVFDALGEMLDVPNMERVWAAPRNLFDRIAQSPYYFRLAYVPGPDLREDFNWVLKAMWRFDTPKLLAVDEFHLVCPNQQGLDNYVNMMLRFSRHDKLGLIGMSQRIADVSKLFTSACRMTILFSTHEARDLEAIKERWGVQAVDMVLGLRPLIYDDLTEVVHQVPQCLVCMKGQAPVVYDFADNKFKGMEIMGVTRECDPDETEISDRSQIEEVEDHEETATEPESE